MNETQTKHQTEMAESAERAAIVAEQRGNPVNAAHFRRLAEEHREIARAEGR